MNYAIVDKNSNRLVAIVDETLKGFFETKFPIFGIVEIGSVGTSTLSTEKGTVNTISVQPKGTILSRDCYHMISNFYLDEIESIEEAYELIKR